MAQSIRSFACPGNRWASFLARLSTLGSKQMDDFVISGASCVDGHQHAQSLSVDLPIASVFFPASSGPLTPSVRVKVSGDAPDILFLQRKTKCLLEDPFHAYFHAGPCQPLPTGRRSLRSYTMWSRLCYRSRKSFYAPCSMSGKSLSSSRLCPLRFLEQKIKLGCGFPASCWNNQADGNHPWLTAFGLWGQTTHTDQPSPLLPFLYRSLGCWTHWQQRKRSKHHRRLWHWKAPIQLQTMLPFTQASGTDILCIEPLS